MDGDAAGPGTAVTVDVGRVQGGQIVLGSGVAGVLGAASIVAAITGHVDGGTGVRVVVFVVGIPFALVGILPLLMWRAAFRRRRLVLDAEGIRWDDPGGLPWTVRWPELAEVAFVYGPAHTGGPGPDPSIELLLRPADPDGVLPGMMHLAAETPDGEAVYRLPFGHARGVAGPIDRGLAAFAPGIYRRHGPEIPPARSRPRAVVASVGLLSLYWAAALAAAIGAGAVAADGRHAVFGTAMTAFWTAVVALWLRRVWTGGPVAVGITARLATVMGVLFLGGTALLGLIAFEVLRQDGLIGFWVVLPGLLGGAAMLAAGRLLLRDDVLEWVAERGAG
ncbi:hypothetical protein [Actinomadura sp. WMMB 499]|uniref:hypothetical protein n=1 Tax=Actinomadura sp. WMMB 499 TaxID=1219491 RepID=UPI00124831C8|nr:hypothetical protein [Actinomadura sp. WMMB 499]QFG21166.1 hypothetical protein F7P10_08445 [Actinomadura sp. WMMB 499]